MSTQAANFGMIMPMRAQIRIFQILGCLGLALAGLAACSRSLPAPSPTIPAPQVVTTSDTLATATATRVIQTPTVEPTEVVTPTRVVTPTPAVFGPVNFPVDISPLTGQPAEDPALLQRRPLAVKIQLYPRTQRPPWGVSKADIVFDFLQNDGLTRLNAIFLSKDADQVGPIRSARLFDGQIMQMYKPIFAFGGADRRILEQLFNAYFSDQLILEGANHCPPMCRVDPNGFNYLFTNTSELEQYASSLGVDTSPQNLDGMLFDARIPAGGQPAQRIFNRYSISAYTRWDYDPQTERYLRYQDTQEDDSGQGEGYAALMDGLTGEQVAADNVVMLLAPHDMVKPETGKAMVDIQVSGSGTAYAVRDGQVFQVLWNRPAGDSVIYLTYEDGTPFPYKPGSTWYVMMGLASQVEKPQADVWRFTFKTP